MHMEKTVREKGDSCPNQADTPHPSSQGGAQTGRQRAPAHSQHPGGANTGFIQQQSLITQLKGFCVTFPSPSSLGHGLQGLTPSHRDWKPPQPAPLNLSGHGKKPGSFPTPSTFKLNIQTQLYCTSQKEFVPLPIG